MHLVAHKVHRPPSQSIDHHGACGSASEPIKTRPHIDRPLPWPARELLGPHLAVLGFGRFEVRAPPGLFHGRRAELAVVKEVGPINDP
jgi:hypothetical protein